MPFQPFNFADLGSLGFGGAALGNLYRPLSEEAARTATRIAVQLGVRYFDTAPHYGFGLSEKRLGSALRELDPAESLNVSTKVGRKLVPQPLADVSQPRQGFVSPEPYESEFDYSYDSVMRTFESSLHRLQRTRIDILYVHDLGPFVHGEDHLRRLDEFMAGGHRALEQLKSSRVIRAIGIGVNETQVAEDLLKLAPFDVVLLAGRYTLLEQDALDTFLPCCELRGVKVIIGAPYNSGILATGVKAGQPQNYNYARASPEVVARVALIEAICEQYEVPLAAAALQFPLAHPQIQSVIPGMATAAEVQAAIDNMRRTIPRQLWLELRDRGLIRADAPVPEEASMHP